MSIKRRAFLSLAAAPLLPAAPTGVATTDFRALWKDLPFLPVSSLKPVVYERQPIFSAHSKEFSSTGRKDLRNE